MSASTTTTNEVKALNKEELKEVLRKAKEKPQLLVLEFVASRSEPSIFLKPVVQEVAVSLGDQAEFYTLDIKEFKDFAKKLQVEAVPTFVVLNKGKVVDRVLGVVSKDDLESSIRKQLVSEEEPRPRPKPKPRRPSSRASNVYPNPANIAPYYSTDYDPQWRGSSSTANMGPYGPYQSTIVEPTIVRPYHSTNKGRDSSSIKSDISDILRRLLASRQLRRAPPEE